MLSSTDPKLRFRMLRKYPGLTIAGGLALAIAIGVGAGWYDFSRSSRRFAAYRTIGSGRRHPRPTRICSA